MNDVLPNALMIGVDYDLFWELNPKSLEPFIKAFQLKQRYEDAMNWNLGNYFRMAIASSMSKNAKYPNKPMLENKESKQHMSPEEIKKRFMAHAELLNARKK
jgi:hypothetical protein